MEHLQATFEAAQEFGLTEAEILATVTEVWGHAGDAAVSELLDEISAALATRILEHERSAGRRVAGDCDLDRRLPA